MYIVRNACCCCKRAVMLYKFLISKYIHKHCRQPVHKTVKQCSAYDLKSSVIIKISFTWYGIGFVFSKKTCHPIHMK